MFVRIVRERWHLHGGREPVLYIPVWTDSHLRDLIQPSPFQTSRDSTHGQLCIASAPSQLQPSNQHPACSLPPLHRYLTLESEPLDTLEATLLPPIEPKQGSNSHATESTNRMELPVSHTTRVTPTMVPSRSSLPQK